jgi:amidophosphoribosyltransferase
VVAEIAGYGLLGFRDPFGIRPLCFGANETDAGTEYMIASESVALEGLGFRLVRDVAPGEAIFVTLDGRFYSQQCAETPTLNPCIFEYVYLARPDSVIDGVSVYGARLRLGEYLADRVRAAIPGRDIDVVMPIPDSSRPAALELAHKLGLEYREGFIKNRYIGRTFIMPGQAVRSKSVRQKLNTVGVEFKGKNVLLVDDSIVRGTTIREIVQMARDAGARKVMVASAAPPVRFPNVYGIDMPTVDELVAHGRTVEQVAAEIGTDRLIYQELDDLISAVRKGNSKLNVFDCSVFTGEYVTGDVNRDYLDHLQNQRSDNAKQERRDADEEVIEMYNNA